MKYMGSKNRIAKEILPIIKEHLNDNNYFVDAFCGGLNLIDKLDYSKRIANDKNHYLIEMWKMLMDAYLNDKINSIPTIICRELYSEYRNSFNNKDLLYHEGMIGWVGFMASYNGRFFDGGYSGHDVNGRDYIGENIRNTFKQLPLLNGITFISTDYKKLVLPSNSVIYCDIPYKNTKQYSTSKDFNHEEFFQWCRDKHSEGHKIFVSEYQAPEDFKCVWSKPVTNSMNQTKTYKPTEKLFTLE